MSKERTREQNKARRARWLSKPENRQKDREEASQRYYTRRRKKPIDDLFTRAGA